MQNRDTSKHGGSTSHDGSSQSRAADPWSDRSQQDRSGDVAAAAKQAYSRFDEAGGEVRSHLERIAGDGRTRIAGELRSVGEAASAAAERLSDEDHDRIGGYVRGIRRQCERAAEYLEQHNAQSLISDVNHLARRNPALFVGGAAVLGLVAGRFLSARPPREDHGIDDYRNEGDWGAGLAQERWPEAPGRYQSDSTSPSRPGVGMGAAIGQTSAGACSTGSPAGPSRSSTPGSTGQVGGTTGRPIGGSSRAEQRHTPGSSPGGSMSDRND